MADMYTRNSGSMHDEIIRYVASTILLAMSVQGDPMTMKQVKGEVEYKDLHYVPEALEYLHGTGLIIHHNIAFTDLYSVPSEVEAELLHVCTCAINDNITKLNRRN